MDYRGLGRTGVKVSAICLGTMTFGQQNSKAEGHAQMDYAVDHSVTIFDVAELYPILPKPETRGHTEAIIGTWLVSRRARDKIIVATKAIGRCAFSKALIICILRAIRIRSSRSSGCSASS